MNKQVDDIQYILENMNNKESKIRKINIQLIEQNKLLRNDILLLNSTAFRTISNVSSRELQDLLEEYWNIKSNNMINEINLLESREQLSNINT